MKKTISLILALILCLSLCACGGSNDVSKDEAPAENAESGENKMDAFEEDYTSLFADLAFYSLTCDNLSSIVYNIWDIVGVDLVESALSYMLSMPDDFDEYWDGSEDYVYNIIECRIGEAYGWMNNPSYGISPGKDAEEFHELCMKYKQLYNDIPIIETSVREQMKAFRANYYATHTDEFNLINELYLSVSSFADICRHPSGSLLSYGTSIKTYSTEIARLVRAADIFYLLS